MDSRTCLCAGVALPGASELAQFSQAYQVAAFTHQAPSGVAGEDLL